MSIKIGIYVITNTLNNKEYVGSSKNLQQRKQSHFSKLKRGVHENFKLQNSFNKYGKDFFKFNILEECPLEVLLERELFYLISKDPFFNICKIPNGTTGYKHTEECKKHMSSLKSKAYKEGLVVPAKGKRLPKEIKERISKTLQTRYQNGLVCWMKGKTHNEDSKVLMVEASYRRTGTHHNSPRGRIFKFDKSTQEVISVFKSAGEASETISTKGTKANAQRKICESAQTQKWAAYGFIWKYESSLDQVKVDELLETLRGNQQPS